MAGKWHMVHANYFKWRENVYRLVQTFTKAGKWQRVNVKSEKWRENGNRGSK